MSADITSVEIGQFFNQTPATIKSLGGLLRLLAELRGQRAR
jgi:hypothetical protein